MEPSDRRAQGAHYTTEKNILKVIEPLFLDDLRAEFQKLQERRDGRSMADLRKFRDRLATLRLFDPACGCGNFLIIAYRELRSLEIEVLREMASRTGATQLKLEVQSVVDVDQFYGIEIGEFPARIAATALWMMDHIMNNRLSLEFGKTYARIPIEKSPHIHHGDALEIDWGEVLPPNECSYVFGNPPFGGAKFQSAGQRSQVRRIAALGGSGGTLDYIAAWFIRAGEYVRRARPENSSRPPRIGFVATNSITQGEQVAQLWPLLLDRLEIAFAHRTFAWGSDARGKAHVHVVIIGLDTTEHAPRDRRLFAYEDLNGEPLESRHAVITPYLFDGGALANPHLVVREESRPINAMPRLKTGVQMIDNGILTFTHEEYCDFLADEPRSLTFFRKYIGGDEYINGFHRWILYLADSSPSDLRHLPKIRERIQRVRQYRASSRRPSTIAMSAYPTKVGVDERLSAPFLVLPNTSSERREYIPIGWLTPEVIANQKLRILPDATLAHFALLTSAMHMAWMRTVTGRMKSDYMYSVGVVYNTFPTPPGFKSENASLSALVDSCAGRARRPRCSPGRDAGRSLRPRPDAAESSKSTSRAGPRRRPSLPPCALHVRARARRVPLCFVRAHAGPAGRKGCWQGQAPGPNKTSASRSNARLTKATFTLAKFQQWQIESDQRLSADLVFGCVRTASTVEADLRRTRPSELGPEPISCYHYTAIEPPRVFRRLF